MNVKKFTWFFLFQPKHTAIAKNLFFTYIQYRHKRNEIQSILLGLTQSPHSSTNLKNIEKSRVMFHTYQEVWHLYTIIQDNLPQIHKFKIQL